MRRCPLLEHSLNIIVKGMNSASAARRQPSIPFVVPNRLNEQEAAQVPVCSYIPAFPYVDPMVSLDFWYEPVLWRHRDGLHDGAGLFPRDADGPRTVCVTIYEVEFLRRATSSLTVHYHPLCTTLRGCTKYDNTAGDACLKGLSLGPAACFQVPIHSWILDVKYVFTCVFRFIVCP